MSETAKLHPECEAELVHWEFQAVQVDGQPEVAKIIDCDGFNLFTVTSGISPFDLRAMLRYGLRQRLNGQQDGRSALQRELRAMLNVPANIAEGG